MSARFDIVISGASFAGLSLASALGRLSEGDLSIALIDPVVERSPPDAAGNPRAFAVSAASRNLFEAIEAWDMVADEAQPVLRIEITDSAVEAGVRSPLTTFGNLTSDGEPASFIVPDGLLGAALFQSARGAPGVTRFAGRTIVRQGIEAKTGLMRVQLDDGDEIGTSLLVGAEGRSSPTRRRAGISLFERDYRQDGICVQVAFERPHRATAVQHFLPGGPFAILPLTGHRACITWSEDREAAKRLMGGPVADFTDALEARIGGGYGAITVVSRAQTWPLKLQMARRLTNERLALVADAARGVHPIAGQGMNLGMRDVAALSEAVIDAARLGLDIGANDVLERYARWRRFDSTTSALAYDRLNGLFSNNWTVLRSLREAGLGVVDRLGFVKQAFTSEAAGLTGDVPKLLKGELV